jgi:hypothetical protein
VPPSDPSTSLGVNEIAFESFHEIAFESFGVRIGVRADDDRVWARLAGLVPPHSRRCDANAIEHHFSVTSDDGAKFTVRYDIRDGIPARVMDAVSYIATDVDLPLALGLLDDYMRSCVGLRAPNRIFIHAGAVGYLDRMIVMPGAALTGKSTLVAALIRAGATYYSDEFAVLDEQGRVHPYATPLRPPGLPGAGQDPADHDGDQRGLAGEEPLPVGAIVLTSYRPGAEWRPRRLSRGEGALALMSLTVPAHDRQEESMRVIRRVFDADPLVIESERDEAEPLASSLLAELERQFSRRPDLEGDH